MKKCDKEIKKELQIELQELFEICVNGQFEVLKSTVEELKKEFDMMSPEELKSIKRTLKNKLDNGIGDIV